MEQDYGPDILTLEDEDGIEHTFEVIDAVDFEGTRYLAVMPITDDADELLDEPADLIIMKVGEEDGEEYLDIVDDDEEFYEVGGVFRERLEEFMANEEPEEDDDEEED